MVKVNMKNNTFNYINGFLFALFTLLILYPFWNLFVQSITAGDSKTLNAFNLWPGKVTLYNYTYILKDKLIWTGYRETLIRTVIGTPLTIITTSAAAYALSKKRMPFHTFWTIFVIIPMFFNGGLIPNYLVIKGLGLIDNRLALILPIMISSFNLLIVRNFFQSLPESLEESAMLEGANSFQILLKVIMPISKPILATITLWTIVGHWNAWFDVLVYIRDPDKYVLQIVLRRILLEGTEQLNNLNSATGETDSSNRVTPDVLKASAVFICTIPILCVYPFLQKYFVKGIMIGSLKG